MSRLKTFVRSRFVSLCRPQIAIVFGLIQLAISCSGLKLDKEGNCLNEKTACFKEDKTPPSFDKKVFPAPNTSVSTLSEIQLMFSEELNNPQPSDFTFTYGDTGMSIISVSKVDRFTYKLLTNRNPIIGGTLTLAFPNLKDYNGNKITNGSVDYTIDLTVPVDTTPDHYGVSTIGYPTIAVTWSYIYEPQVAGNTVYTVKLTSGSTDCNAGTPVTPVTSDATVGVTALNSGQTYHFTIDTTTIIAAGAYVILVCVDNNVNNKHGTGTINVVRDNSAPLLADVTVSPAGGNYVSPQTLTFACSDNADRVIYNLFSNVLSGTDPTAGSVNEPRFNTTTGAVMDGTVYDPNNKPVTPYSDNTTRTIYKYRCIDKAGNMTPVNANPAKVSGVYRINSTYPTVTLASLTKTGATPAVAITGIGAGGHTSATLQWSTNQAGQDWEIRSGGTDCGVGGTVVASGSGGTATPAPANTPILTTIIPTSPGIAVGLNDLRICVTNGTDWGQTGFFLLRDDTAPTTQTVNVPAGNYGSTQNLVFSCSDNEDRVLYTQSFSTPSAVPADPGDPVFDPDGRVTLGTVQSTPLKITTDTTALVGQKTLVKWRCIDKAGHVYPTVNSATYIIDTLLPTITVQNQTRVAISTQPGAYGTSQITWVSDRGGSTYDIRRGSTNCTDGTVLTSGTNLSGAAPAANTPVTSTINANATNFPGGEAAYTIHICVTNFSSGKGYTSRSLTYDTTSPQIPTPTPTIAQVDATNFTLSWTAATDAGGSGVAGYRIFRGPASNNFPGYPNTPDYTATSSPATLAMPDTQVYYLRIVPVDAAGNVSGGGTPYYAEIATKPTITVIVSGLSGGNFDLTDGNASLNISSNGSNSWTTTLGIGAQYNFNVTTQPAGQVCSIRQLQYGTLNSNLTINVECAVGFMVGGRFQAMAPAPLNYQLYRGRVTTLAGSGATGSLNNANGLSAQFTNPESLVYLGNALYVSDSNNRQIRRVSLTSPYAVTTFAGSASAPVGDTTDDAGGCLGAKFGVVNAITTDGFNLYVAEFSVARRIRKISDLSGTCTVTTLAGAGPVGYVDGPAMTAQFSDIFALASDGTHLYASEAGNQRIRKINLASGIVSTIAGDGSSASTDSATGTSASFNTPTGLAIIGSDLYVGDICFSCTGNNGNKIRRVSLIAPYPVTTVAGIGGAGGLADGAANTARFNNPISLVSDGSFLFVADLENSVIRRIDPNNGYRVVTLAGRGSAGHIDGTGPQAMINKSHGVTTDGRTIYFAEWGGHRIKKLEDFGLMGYWPLTAASSTQDYNSGNTNVNNGTITGGLTNMTDRFGAASNAKRFGSGNYILSATTTGLPAGNSDRTVCAWVNPNSPASSTHLIVTYGQRSASGSFGLYSFSDGIVESVGITGFGDDLRAPHKLTVNKWTHLCATYNGTTARLHIQGRPAISAAKSYSTGSTHGIGIGTQTNGSQQFSGQISDVRIYSRVLSEGEINTLAQDVAASQVDAGVNTGPTGLLTHYEFNDGIPTTATLTPSGPIGGNLGTGCSSPPGKDGDPSGSCYFGGGSAMSTVANSTGLPIGNAPRTLCGWYRPETMPANRPLLAYGSTSGNNQGMGITLLNSTTVQIWSWGSTTVSFSYNTRLNTWQHLCGTLNGTAVEMFADGKSLGTGTIPSHNGAIGQITLGSNLDNTLIFNGNIDDLRIYDSVLSAAQIRQLATQIPTGLVLRLDMAGDGNDVSGAGQTLSGNSGTLTTGRQGMANTAYQFSSGQAIQIANRAELNPQMDGTWTFWIKSPNFGTMNISIFNKYDSATPTGWVFKYDQTNYFHGWGIGGGGQSAFANSSSVGSNDIWDHVAFVRTGSTMTVYLNGASITNIVSGNGAANTLNNFQVLFGVPTGSGTITTQDARIYNRALSASEVFQLAQRNTRIFVTAAGYNPGTNFTSPVTADRICNTDAGRPAGGIYKALIVDAANRRACALGGCAGSGAGEHLDWVFQASQRYFDSTAALQIAITDGIGLLPTALNNSVSGNTKYWTGINADWTSSANTCANWSTTTAVSAIQGNGISTTAAGLLGGWGSVGCSLSPQQLLCIEQ